MVSSTPRPHFTPGKKTVPILHESGWTPGPIWTCAENLAHTGIRSPDPPTRNQSLYRLSYPGPHSNNYLHLIMFVGQQIFRGCKSESTFLSNAPPNFRKKNNNILFFANLKYAAVCQVRSSIWYRKTWYGASVDRRL